MKSTRQYLGALFSLPVAAALVSGSALAKSNNPADRMLRKLKLSQSVAGVRKRQSIKSQCVNFSGHWKGTCRALDGSDEPSGEEMKLEQSGCTSLDYDGLPATIGGNTTISSVVPADDSSGVGCR